MKKQIEWNLGKILNFRMSMAALSRIEEKFKKPFAKIEHENMLITEFIYMLWSCLDQKNRDEIQPLELLNLIDDHSEIKTMYEKFGEIVAEGFGQEKNELGTQETNPNGLGNQPLLPVSVSV
jgi:hypothetical protein